MGLGTEIPLPSNNLSYSYDIPIILLSTLAKSYEDVHRDHSLFVVHINPLDCNLLILFHLFWDILTVVSTQYGTLSFRIHLDLM